VLLSPTTQRALGDGSMTLGLLPLGKHGGGDGAGEDAEEIENGDDGFRGKGHGGLALREVAR